LSAPNIVKPPADLEIYPGQAARFSVSACAFPVAGYQWYSNNVPIEGATDPTLRMPNATLAMSGTEFRVRIANALGSNSAKRSAHRDSHAEFGHYRNHGLPRHELPRAPRLV